MADLVSRICSGHGVFAVAGATFSGRSDAGQTCSNATRPSSPDRTCSGYLPDRACHQWILTSIADSMIGTDRAVWRTTVVSVYGSTQNPNLSVSAGRRRVRNVSDHPLQRTPNVASTSPKSVGRQYGFINATVSLIPRHAGTVPIATQVTAIQIRSELRIRRSGFRVTVVSKASYENTGRSAERCRRVRQAIRCLFR